MTPQTQRVSIGVAIRRLFVGLGLLALIMAAAIGIMAFYFINKKNKQHQETLNLTYFGQQSFLDSCTDQASHGRAFSTQATLTASSFLMNHGGGWGLDVSDTTETFQVSTRVSASRRFANTMAELPDQFGPEDFYFITNRGEKSAPGRDTSDILRGARTTSTDLELIYRVISMVENHCRISLLIIELPGSINPSMAGKTIEASLPEN